MATTDLTPHDPCPRCGRSLLYRIATDRFECRHERCGFYLNRSGLDYGRVLPPEPQIGEPAVGIDPQLLQYQEEVFRRRGILPNPIAPDLAPSQSTPITGRAEPATTFLNCGCGYTTFDVRGQYVERCHKCGCPNPTLHEHRAAQKTIQNARPVEPPTPPDNPRMRMRKLRGKLK